MRARQQILERPRERLSMTLESTRLAPRGRPMASQEPVSAALMGALWVDREADRGRRYKTLVAFRHSTISRRLRDPASLERETGVRLSLSVPPRVEGIGLRLPSVQMIDCMRSITSDWIREI